MTNRRLLPIFLTVFIDLLGFGLILPLLPFYAETFGATATVIGLITASYAAAQLIGAPILGRLSDRYGRKPILTLSIAGTCLGFVVLGLANPLGGLIGTALGGALSVVFASRILAGLTGGNISVAQAYISDVTDERGRTRALGMIGAAFGLGFIFGPALGGFLSTWGYDVPSFVAAGLAAVNLVWITLSLPESLTPERRSALAGRRSAAFSPASVWAALNRQHVGPLLSIRFFFGLAFVTFQSIFALYAQANFGLSAQSTSFILSYIGVLQVFVQGVAIGRLTGRFSDGMLIVGGIGLMALAMVGWALAPSLPVLLGVLAPLALAGGVLNTVLNSALTKSVRPEEIGGTLGLGASVESLTRVIAPSVGGLLFQDLGYWAPGVFAAVVLVGILPFAWQQLLVRDHPAKARPFAGSGFARAAQPIPVEAER